MTTKLNKWTADLLSHESNSAKTSIERVILSFDDWKAEKKEKEEALNQLERDYTENHSAPRLQKEIDYETFVATQKELIDNWKTSRDQTVLNEIITLERAPANYKEDPIYTMYYYQYNL